jgi:hypothetical protein
MLTPSFIQILFQVLLMYQNQFSVRDLSIWSIQKPLQKVMLRRTADLSQVNALLLLSGNDADHERLIQTFSSYA